MTTKNKVAIIGSGLIGKSFAMLFACGGYPVTLYDLQEGQLKDAKISIGQQLKDLEEIELKRGTLSPDETLSLVTTSTSMKEATANAFWIWECISEDLELKQKLFAELDNLIQDDKTIVSSSTSMQLPSDLQKRMTKHQSQVLVCHPLNPPFYNRCVEVVPSSQTNKDLVTMACNILKDLGQKPVLIKKEVFGFVVNKVQGALLNACWELLEDDVISVEDLDVVMKDGLGNRYAFMGPMESIHLNAEGIYDYYRRFGQGYARITGVNIDPESTTTQRVNKEMSEAIPLTELNERRRWRDKRLAALAKLKQEMDSEGH